MSTIAQILAEHDTLCMDSEEDRATLAAALQTGLAMTLRDLAEGFWNDDSVGIEAAAEHIEMMAVE